MSQIAIHEGWAADERLASLGLSADMLVRSAQRAAAEAATCTAFDARGAAGSLMWTRILRYLREELAMTGWDVSRPRNSELTYHRELGLQLVVTSGDRMTGQMVGSPQPKDAKGPTFFEAVDSNQDPFDVGPSFSTPDLPERRHDDQLETWVVVYRLSGRQLHLEVSKPASVDPSGYILWDERIIVSVPMPDGPDFSQVDPDDDNGGPYTVSVERLG